MPLDDFTAGLAAIEKEDEPTLLVLTDAVNLAVADYHALCQAALLQCSKLGDRFVILDVKKDAATEEEQTDIEMFREGINTSHLMYGAAYHPYLQTSLNYAYEETGVTILPPPPWSKEIAANTIKVSYAGPVGEAPSVQIVDRMVEVT